MGAGLDFVSSAAHGSPDLADEEVALACHRRVEFESLVGGRVGLREACVLVAVGRKFVAVLGIGGRVGLLVCDGFVHVLHSVVVVTLGCVKLVEEVCRVVARFEGVHPGGCLQIEVVVLAVLGDGEHLDDVLHEVEVVGSRVEAGLEQGDEIVAAGDLTADEQGLEVGTNLLHVLCLGAGLGLRVLEVGQIVLVAGDDVFRTELTGFVQADGRLQVEEEQAGLGGRAVGLDDLGELLVQARRVVLYVVGKVLALVVEGGDGVLGPCGGTGLVDGHERVDEGCPIDRILGVAADEHAHEGGAVDEHGLVGRGRADPIGLAPVGHCVVVCLLLEVFFVVGEVLDAFRTVLSVLSLSKSAAAEGEHQG